MADDGGMQFDITTTDLEKPQDIYNTREIIVFAIDCADSMFQKYEDGDSPFKVSLQCCRSVLMKKIIGSSSDQVAIVFYGTREKDFGDHYPKHVFTFIEPEQPNADNIKKIDAILNSDNYNDFDTKYGHSDECLLSDALWRCSYLIARCKVKVNIKKVLLFTCNDAPHQDSSARQHYAFTKGEDYETLSIMLEVIALKKDFDGDLFYNDLLKIVNGDDAKVEPSELLIQELVEGRFRKDCKKRSLANLIWNLGGDVQLSVEMYCFYRSLSIPPIRKLYRNTNESVKSVTQVYHAETGERLLKTDLNQKIEIGEVQLKFENEEKNKLGFHEQPGITLLGFKSMAYLNPEYHMQTASFLYPTEGTVKGSTKLFKALLEKCFEKEKFALCYMISRARSKPKLVALVPQKEIVDEVQIMPAGFHVIYLPYADHIRDIELPKKENIENEEVQLCKKILKKVTIKYKVGMFENAKIQTHWANIEALALDYKEARKVVDLTVPNLDFVSKCRLKDLERQFLDKFFVDGYDPEEEAARKRKYPYSGTTSGAAVKAPKFDPSDPDYVEKMAKAKLAEKLTVPVIKSFLVDRGVNVSGFKKNDLVNTLYKELNIDV